MAPKNERRQHKRLKAGYPVKAEYAVGWKNVKEKTTLENVCSGGIKFRSESKVKKGSKIEVEIRIPGKVVNKILGIDGLDPKTEVNFRSTGVVIRRECVPNGKDLGYVAVKFTGPLQISTSDSEKE
jgi:hypothetical protein